MQFHYIILAVTVNFGHVVYYYTENHGVVSDIIIVLSTEFAQGFTVTVFGGI